MSNHVAPHTVVSEVRADGAIGVFERRSFDLMLGPDQTPDQKVKEAIRILRQIGYETRGVTVSEPS